MPERSLPVFLVRSLRVPLFSLACWLVILAPLARSQEKSAVPSTPQTAQQFQSAEGQQLRYWLALPQALESKKSWPLMLFLHGAGERGEDLELVKKHGPPKLLAEGKTFPCIVISPPCPAGRLWDPKLLSLLLDDVTKKYPVDLDRLYVTGLSRGGFGTWSLAAETPQRFAAIAPICGGGQPSTASQLTHLPIWVFHGALDKAVPLDRSEQMVKAIRDAGGKVEFTVYPDVGHDSWTATYANPKFYAWLFAQQLAGS